MSDDDLIERHVDLVAGVGAMVWAIAATYLVPVDPNAPALADLCSPFIAAIFGIGALTRWYRKRRKEAAPA